VPVHGAEPSWVLYASGAHGALSAVVLLYCISDRPSAGTVTTHPPPLVPPRINVVAPVGAAACVVVWTLLLSGTSYMRHTQYWQHFRPLVQPQHGRAGAGTADLVGLSGAARPEVGGR